MAKHDKKSTPAATVRADSAGTGDSVYVALNRASGIRFPLPDGRRVLIEGNAAALRGKEKGVLPVGAYGLTRVAADDWAYIEKTYGPHMEIFENGLIFARERKADTADQADERAELRHGLEPVDVQTANTRPFEGANEV